MKYKPYTDTGAVSKDAVHQRQIVFVKEQGIWVVLDKMTNCMNKNNTYSQVWNLPGYVEDRQDTYTGFENDDVYIDNENNIAYTHDLSGPNIFIRAFSNKSIDVKKYCGEYKSGEAGIGWFRGPNFGTAMGEFYPKTE